MRFLKTLYLNLTFGIGFIVLSTVGIAVMGLALVILSLFVPKRKMLHHLRTAISIYGRGVIALGYPLVKVEVEDRTDLDLITDGPFIFVFNHRSSSDPFLVSTQPLGTEFVQVVNKWPLKLPVLGILARFAKYLDVNTLSFDEFKEKSVELLDEGVGIIFFPEGTRSGSTEMGHFRSAAFKLFLETKVPIIPVCISGNERIPYKGSLKLSPGLVKVRYLPPVHWQDYKDSNAFKVKKAVQQIMANELKEMDDR